MPHSIMLWKSKKSVNMRCAYKSGHIYAPSQLKQKSQLYAHFPLKHWYPANEGPRLEPANTRTPKFKGTVWSTRIWQLHASHFVSSLMRWRGRGRGEREKRDREWEERRERGERERARGSEWGIEFFTISASLTDLFFLGTATIVYTVFVV